MNQKFYQCCQNADEGLLTKKKKRLRDYWISQDWPKHWWQLTHGSIYQTAQFEGSLIDRKVSFPGSLFGLNHCQGPQIVTAYSRLLSLPEILYQQILFFICVWKVKSTVHLISFRNFLKPLSCLLPEYKGTSLYKKMLHHFRIPVLPTLAVEMNFLISEEITPWHKGQAFKTTQDTRYWYYPTPCLQS